MARCLLLLLVIAALAAAMVLVAPGRGGGSAATEATGVAPAVTVTETRTVTVTVTAGAGALGHMEYFVPDREYYPVAAALVRDARKCICIAMYIMKYDPRDPDDPVNDLLRLVAEKARRGVKVYVLLDDETLREYPETVAFLRSAGAEIRLDESPRRLMHAKLVIVDNETVLLGSHNWSESAMRYNHEASIATSDPGVVAEAVSYFKHLWEAGRPAG